jgi:tetratricopeptide (TPR) repeat protein
MKHLTAIFLLLLIVAAAKAEDFKAEIYKAYISGDMNKWEQVLGNMEIVYKSNPDYKLLENIVEVQYGLIGYLIGQDEDKKAEKIMEVAEKNLDVLMNRNNKIARYWAYKSAFTGFKIGISPYKAPFLGPRSFAYINEALALDENNPYVLMEYANGKYYAPAFAGGDKPLALKSFQKALRILEQDSLNLKNSWYYLMAKTNYGTALLKKGDKTDAIRIFDEILAFEPHYTWVAEELKPKALKN